MPDVFYPALFPEELMKMSQKTLSSNVKYSEKKHPGSIPISGSAPQVKGVYSGPSPILKPSSVEIHSVGFFCNPADKPANKWTRVKT